jgi:hypothetical protein
MKPPPYLMRLLQTAFEGRGWSVEVYGPIGDLVEVTLEHMDGPIATAEWRLVDPWDPSTGWRYAGGTIRPHPTAREAQISVRDLLREVQRIGGAR